MGYFIGVILQTVLLPVLSGGLELGIGGGDPIEVFGRWWVFWGVGTRLLVAGCVQLLRPDTTARILGSAEATPAEVQVARELSMANVGMGLAGLLALVPVWAPAAGAAGGAFLLAAGLMHVRKTGKSPQELLATWSDLLVGVVVVVFVVYALVARPA